jgi:hypothetical protein
VGTEVAVRWSRRDREPDFDERGRQPMRLRVKLHVISKESAIGGALVENGWRIRMSAVGGEPGGELKVLEMFITDRTVANGFEIGRAYDIDLRILACKTD